MKKKPRGRLICMFLCLAILLSGCTIGKSEIVWSTGLRNWQAFKIEDEDCSMGQATLLLANYKNIYTNLYGKEIWKTKHGPPLEEYIKDTALSQLAKMTCMSMLAEKEGLSLNAEEKKGVSQAAGKYFKSMSDDEIEFFQVTQDEILELYQRFALATKMYTDLTGGVNEEVSDDDARVMDVLMIYVESDTAAREIDKKLKAGDDFITVANCYNEAPRVEESYSRDNIPKEVAEVVFKLEKGENSPCMESEEGYYFVQCVDKLNRDETEKNKKVIVEKRAKEAFNDVYNNFVEGLDTEYNSSIWEETDLAVDNKIKTASFFDVFETYCGKLAGK